MQNLMTVVTITVITVSKNILFVDAYNNEATIHYYQKNGFRFLVEDERLEAKYVGIGVGRLPLHTRLMYYDLIFLDS